MACRILTTCIRQGNKVQAAGMSSWHYEKIGSREIVGFGMNGLPSYIDRHDFPMPAIRFKENTPDIQALREKEKGDWKKLSIEEKKALYRASFCQTFAEIEAPTGEWKSIVGMALVGISLGIWMFVFCRYFVYPPYPKSFDEEHRLAQLDRIRKLDINPIEGINRRDR